MATQIQFRRGTTAEHSTFTGAVGEVTVDTTKDTAVVHDGTTAGGIPLAKESAIPSTGTIASQDADSVNIDGGAIDGTAIGANSASTGVFTSLETTGGFTEDAEAITSSSNAATLDLSSATNFTHALSEDVTYTFSNPASSGKASAFTLKVTQDSTERTITWPASVDWAGGTAPTISDGDGDVDYFVFITTDGGSNYYGFTAGQALATPA
jgi:hypothetical protein